MKQIQESILFDANDPELDTNELAPEQQQTFKTIKLMQAEISRKLIRKYDKTDLKNCLGINDTQFKKIKCLMQTQNHFKFTNLLSNFKTKEKQIQRQPKINVLS